MKGVLGQKNYRGGGSSPSLFRVKAYPLELHRMYINGDLMLLYFRIRPRLQQYFPHSRQTIYVIRIILSMFPFSLFPTRVSGKRSIEKPLLICTIIFFFFQVGCTAMYIRFLIRFRSAAWN